MSEVRISVYVNEAQEKAVREAVTEWLQGAGVNYNMTVEPSDATEAFRRSPVSAGRCAVEGVVVDTELKGCILQLRKERSNGTLETGLRFMGHPHGSEGNDLR